MRSPDGGPGRELRGGSTHDRNGWVSGTATALAAACHLVERHCRDSGPAQGSGNLEGRGADCQDKGGDAFDVAVISPGSSAENGARTTPRSVMMAVISSFGVTSKLGLRTGMSRGATG